MVDFQPISSSDNNKVKLLGKLASKKYRQEFEKFIVENLVIIRDALSAGFDFEALFVTQEFADKHQDDISFLQLKSKSTEFYLIDEKLNKSFSELDTPSGIAAVYAIKTRDMDRSSVIYLNGISDPGNLGTIMRDCLAFGFKNVILDAICTDMYNSKTISAAKDSIFKLNVIKDSDCSWFKTNSLPVYAAVSENGTDLSGFKPAKDFCLVLGSESHGIDPKILDLAAERIKIEMSGDIESLNVAAAAAILLYELGKK